MGEMGAKESNYRSKDFYRFLFLGLWFLFGTIFKRFFLTTRVGLAEIHLTF